MFRSARLLSSFAIGSLLAAPIIAGPTVASVSPRALQSGGATTLTITGDGLLPAPRLLLPLSGVQQSMRPGATAKRMQIDVSLEAQSPGGIYQFRVANESGVSSPQAVSVDSLPQMPFAEHVASLPIALHGSISGSALARTTLDGKAGQRLVADVEARRLGSPLNPVVRLYDAKLVQLAYAQTAARLDGDARLDVVLPRDGQYTVEVHDALYRGAGQGYFRLKLGDLHYADLAFPLGVQQGARGMVGFASSSLPTDLKTLFDAASPAQAAPVPWPPAERLVGGRPWVVVSNLPEIVEPANAQPNGVPAALNGRLSQAGEEDRYTLQVSPGMKLHFEMFAVRAGSPVDGVLTLRSQQGSVLASNDDRPNTTDPALDFTVPAGMQQLVLAVKDLLGRGGESFIYRVAVTDARQGDFELSVQEDRIEIPQGGTTLVQVQAKRAGYNGLIRLQMEGLPAGVALSGAEIPAGANGALVSFSASDISPTQMLVRLVGQSGDGSLVRTAEFPDSPATRLQPWLSTELAAAITPPGALQVAWNKVSTEGALPLGGSLLAESTVVRRGDAKGSVRLSLIATQTIPKKNVNNKQVEDLDRALRLDGTPLIAVNETQATARILVPGDLPVISYDLALKAELLSPDGKTVVATALTPGRRFVPQKPSFTLELAGEPQVQARAGSGETGKLVGKLVRSPGFDQNVVLSLAGLPKGAKSPQHIVLGNRSDFEFPVVFPVGTPAGELKNVKLVASSQLNAKTAIKSGNEIALAVTVVAGETIQPEQPLAVFEDQEEFVSSLAASPAAMLATEVKYSGTACVRVKPTQPGNPQLPGLQARIRQYPGPGEYRYLRFAWRKEGGRIICLQVGHDGKFGPMPGSRSSFRYHAGPGPECFGASESLNDKIPTEFTVVTRDLFADFGEFTFTGLGLAAIDGNAALFDHIYLAKQPEDFTLVAPK